MIKDVQNQKDFRNIPIQKVGVKDVEIPLKIERKSKGSAPELERVFARAKMSVSLTSEFKGTHMSRFIEVLNKYRDENLLTSTIEKILFDVKQKLDATNSYLKFSFKYFIEKFAPVSALNSLMCYDCAFEGELDDNCEFRFYLIATVPITTLCPCSKEISKYGAHNQRAKVKVRISYDNDEHIWLADLAFSGINKAWLFSVVFQIATKRKSGSDRIGIRIVMHLNDNIVIVKQMLQ